MIEIDSFIFEWTKEELTDTSLKLKLHFRSPGMISVSQVPDELIIKIDEIYDINGKLIAKDYLIKK